MRSTAASAAGWASVAALDRRPYRPDKRNYDPIMIIAVAGILMLGRHLLSLVADI